MLQGSKLRLRELPGQPKAGVCVSESRGPRQPPVPAGCLGAAITAFGRRASTAVAGPAGWKRAGPPQGSGSSAEAARGGTEVRVRGGHPSPGGPPRAALAPRPTRWRLRWLRDWLRGPGLACLGGPCQPGRGAVDLGWLPHAGWLPWPRHLQKGSTEMLLGWRSGSEQLSPRAPPENGAVPHPGAQQVLGKPLPGSMGVTSGLLPAVRPWASLSFPICTAALPRLPTYEVVRRLCSLHCSAHKLSINTSG